MPNTKPVELTEQQMQQREEEEKRINREYRENVARQLEETKGIYKEYDSRRYTGKAEIRQLVESWKKQLGENSELLKDKELEAIFKLIDRYGAIDVSATHAGTMNNNVVENVSRELYDTIDALKEEGRVLQEILKKTNQYIEKLNREALDYSHKENEDKTQISEKERLQTSRQIMAENIKLFFDDLSGGHLDKIPEGAQHIVCTNIEIARDGDKNIDLRDQPLFPHEPSPNDINQGYIGDCYLVGALSAVALSDPDRIKQAMRDNGDGTVTVRLFQCVPPEDQPEEERKPHNVMKPFYVTVDKVTPEKSSAWASVWVNVIERAVAASGLRKDAQMYYFSRPVPANIDELYEKYSKMPEYERPTKIECPWLFDENDNLVKWKPSYEHIIGGDSGVFLQSFLGESFGGVEKELSKVTFEGSKELTYEFIIKKIGERTTPEFAQKIRNLIDGGTMSHKINNAVAALASVDDPEFDWQNTNFHMHNSTLAGCRKNEEMSAYVSLFSSMQKGLNSYMSDANIKENASKEFEEYLHSEFEKAGEKIRKNPKMSKVADRIKKLQNEILAEKESVTEHISGGTYAESYEKTFEEIKKHLAEGSVVSAATPSRDGTDRRKAAGLNYQHEYSILGTTEEVIEVNGKPKTFKFLIVRNPHGDVSVPEYDFTKNPPFATGAEKEDSQGIFKMELSHFMSGMENVNINSKDLPLKIKYQCSDKLSRMISKYDRLMSVMIKDMDEIINDGKGGSSIACAKQSLETIRKEMIGNRGLGFEATARKMGEHLMNVEYDLERKKLEPEAHRMLTAVKKLMEFGRDGVQEPLKEFYKGLSGYPLHKDKGLYDFAAIDDVHELSDGLENDIREYTAAGKLYKGADSVFVTSSKAYREIGEAIKAMGTTLKAFNEDRNCKNMSQYIKDLAKLGKKCRDYIQYKAEARGRTAGGQVKAKSSFEKQRIEMAEKLAEYAEIKSEALYRSVVELNVAVKVMGVMFPDAKLVAESDEIKEFVQTKGFKEVIKGKSADEIKQAMADPQQIKAMAKDYINKEHKPGDKKCCDQYFDKAQQKYDKVIGNSKSTQEQKLDAAAKLIYADMVKKLRSDTPYMVIKNEEKAVVEFIKTSEKFSKYVENELDENLPQNLASDKTDNTIDRVRGEVREFFRKDGSRNIDGYMESKADAYRANPDKAVIVEQPQEKAKDGQSEAENEMVI